MRGVEMTLMYRQFLVFKGEGTVLRSNYLPEEVKEIANF